jgi:arginyl-tRNA synthetase (EC 6.1.1.19)
VEAGELYGRGTLYDGVTMNLEFVSANPTGPLHIGAPAGPRGDSLARIFLAQGGLVTREYYFNDHGAQIDRSRAAWSRPSAASRRRRTATAASTSSTSRRACSRCTRATSTRSADELLETFRSVGVDLMFGDIKASLHDFGVDFDVYFHENELHESGAVDHAVARLRELATSTRPTAPPGCAPPSSATTKTGS